MEINNDRHNALTSTVWWQLWNSSSVNVPRVFSQKTTVRKREALRLGIGIVYHTHATGTSSPVHGVGMEIREASQRTREDNEYNLFWLSCLYRANFIPCCFSGTMPQYCPVWISFTAIVYSGEPGSPQSWKGYCFKYSFIRFGRGSWSASIVALLICNRHRCCRLGALFLRVSGLISFKCTAEAAISFCMGGKGGGGA